MFIRDINKIPGAGPQLLTVYGNRSVTVIFPDLICPFISINQSLPFNQTKAPNRLTLNPMQKRFVFFLFMLFAGLCTRAQIPPIGQWREHLSYNQAIQVAGGKDLVYCATPYSIFTVAIADNTIERFSKLNGLHETGIQYMQWDAVARKDW